MNALELYNLRKFCRKYEIDIQEIDDSLTYSENIQRLKSFLMQDAESLANAYAKSYGDWEKSTTIGERYGLSESSIATVTEVQRIRIKAVIKYRFRHGKTVVKVERKIVEIINGYINPCFRCPYSNGCENKLRLRISKQVIIVYASTTALMMVQHQLDTHNIRFKVLRLKMNTKGLQWISGKGWVRRPS